MPVLASVVIAPVPAPINRVPFINDVLPVPPLETGNVPDVTADASITIAVLVTPETLQIGRAHV